MTHPFAVIAFHRYLAPGSVASLIAWVLLRCLAHAGTFWLLKQRVVVSANTPTENEGDYSNEYEFGRNHCSNLSCSVSDISLTPLDDPLVMRERVQ